MRGEKYIPSPIAAIYLGKPVSYYTNDEINALLVSVGAWVATEEESVPIKPEALYRLLVEIAQRRVRATDENRNSKRSQKLIHAVELLQGKLDAFRLHMVADDEKHAASIDDIEDATSEDVTHAG